MSSNEPLIRALDGFVFANDQLAFARDRGGQGAFLHPFAAKLLLSCRSFATPAEHAARFQAQARETLKREAQAYLQSVGGGGLFGAVDKAVARALEELQRAGALQTRSGFAQALAGALGEPQPALKIGALGIPTANRPKLLERALESYLAHVRAAGRDLRAVVSDDSRDPAVAEQNRAVAAEAAKKYGRVEYLGQAERARLIEEHAQGNAARRRALEFLLTDPDGLGQTYGMTRNALLLATRGELLLCADDDTVCRPMTPPSARPGLELLDAGSAVSVDFYPSREAALGEVRPAQRDLLSIHEAFLGRSLAAGLLEQTRQPDFTVGELTPRGARKLSRAEDRVAFTLNGLVGDSGSTMEDAAIVSTFSPEAVASLGPSGALTQLLAQRQVVKVAPWPRAASGDNFMTTVYGHDNRRWTLPFFPHLRSEDQVFKELFVRADPSAELVYLPCALEHASPSPHRPAPSAVVLLDIVLAALADVPRPGPGADVAARVRELGNHLVRFAERPLPRFRRAVYEVVAFFTLTDLGRQRAFLEASRAHLPAALAEKVQASIQRLEAIATGPELVCAEQPWIERFGPAQAEERMRSTLRRFGEAMAVMAE